MSSEGSVSSEGSRIRQFGLYRSIDARTEEFLRLSRKRQIRQGCACAAVSTAITVAVVVVVICVYEFSLNTQVDTENSFKKNWFSIINDTALDGHFETKFMKSSIDKTTLTLLPILLKALKKNIVYDKIIEDQSSSSPIYDERKTTEYNLEENIITRRWFQLPKLYSITYKTSPVRYYRSPSESIEYFTKIRKIRNYQRIINYFDKMISEKVYIGSTQPLMKAPIPTEQPTSRTQTQKSLTENVQIRNVTLPLFVYIESTQPLMKAPIPIEETTSRTPIQNSFTENIQIRNVTLPFFEAPKVQPLNINLKNAKDKYDYEKGKCECPKKIGQLLYKVLSGIQKLLPPEKSTNKKLTKNCHHKISLRPNVTASTPSIVKERNKTYHLMPSSSMLQTIYKKEPYYPNKNDMVNEEIITTNQDIFLDHSQTPLTYSKDQSYEVSSPIINYFVDSTDVILKSPTKPMANINKYREILNRKSIVDIFRPKTKRLDTKKTTIDPVYDRNEYDDSLLNTTTIDNIQDLFKNSILELTDKIIPNTTTQKNLIFFSTRNEINNITIKPITDVEITTISTKNLTVDLNKAIYHTTANAQNKSISNVTPMPTTALYTSDKNNSSTILNDGTEYAIENILTTIIDEKESLHNLTQKELLNKIENTIDLPIQKDDTVIKKLNWEELENKNIQVLNSMIPTSRPTYLEIYQRNDWKHDEQEYDFNVINNYDIYI